MFPSACSASTSQLVRGRHPGENGRPANCFGEARVVERVELRPRQRRGTGLHDSKVGGDACGSARVVAGDHDHADAGPMGLANGNRRLLARRVDDAYGAHEHQVAFERFRDLRVLARGEGAVGHGQGAQRRV